MCPACIAAAVLIAAKVSSAAGMASVFIQKLAAKTDAPNSIFKPPVPTRSAEHS
jgi:hypothetical protein